MEQTQDELFMPFPQPQLEATFLSRPQRFLAEMMLSDGTQTLAYCANPGSLNGCLRTGCAALLWDSEETKRKRRYTWRAILLDGVWVGTDTHLANRLVARALQQQLLPGFRGFEILESESLIHAGLRLDFLLTQNGRLCFLEVKTAIVVVNGIARFPDSVTPRGLKHLQFLTCKAEEGHRAVLLFVVQRGDAKGFAVCDLYDSAYAEAFAKALAAGVQVGAVAVDVSAAGFGKPRVLSSQHKIDFAG